MAYATDPAIFEDFEADLSSLLEVPDLGFPSSQDFPSASYRDSAFASSSAAGTQAWQPVSSSMHALVCQPAVKFISASIYLSNNHSASLLPNPAAYAAFGQFFGHSFDCSALACCLHFTGLWLLLQNSIAWCLCLLIYSSHMGSGVIVKCRAQQVSICQSGGRC